jgi:hypothetical protein
LIALSENFLARESLLYIYADGPKENATKVEKERIIETRQIAKSEKWCKEVTLIESDTNKGLAISIITGVTGVVNQYGKVIVLEDDIVTSPYFLKFMNSALDYYIEDKIVWHISGWNYQIQTDGLTDVFFWRTMNCWGWATWYDRWIFYKKEADNLILLFNKKDIYQFNIYGADNMWHQVISNKNGKINTWAIFWYAEIFKRKGLCLNPAVSFVRNIGFDNTGVHCGESMAFSNDILCKKEIDFSTIKIKENKKAIKKIMAFYKALHGKKNIFIRIINKTIKIVKNICLRNNLI